ncbi:MAG: cell division protein ZapA [Saprospiraceae bacterium]|nr:cell division protein ZapA [Bacteroidia bacterium]MBT8229621.1 cell division protein ZapA [Bacteroidia bacterium]NNF21772.1 cell division protein ZapA [Saprospiraceae bacterium]
MANDHMISYNIRVAGKSFPVKLTENEQHLAEIIETELNDRISEYKMKYSIGNTNDILSMLLITYAFELKTVDQKQDLDAANTRILSLIDKVSELID